MQTNTYLSDKTVATRYEVGRATVWRWVQESKFPAPVKLSPGCTRWKLSDIEEWEANQKQVAHNE